MQRGEPAHSVRRDGEKRADAFRGDVGRFGDHRFETRLLHRYRSYGSRDSAAHDQGPFLAIGVSHFITIHVMTGRSSRPGLSWAVANEIRRSPLAMVVLAHLAEAPMHVYRMQQLIKERAKDTVVNVAQRNSLYQTIARLVRDELVRVQQTSRDENRPERVIYEISEAGRSTLDRWLEEMLGVPAREFPEFPAALAFIALVPPKRAKERLEARRDALQERLRDSRAAMARTLASGLPRLFLLEDEYKNAVTQAEIAWLDGVIADLARRKLTWSRAWLREIARRMSASR